MKFKIFFKFFNSRKKKDHILLTKRQQKYKERKQQMLFNSSKNHSCIHIFTKIKKKILQKNLWNNITKIKSINTNN